MFGFTTSLSDLVGSTEYEEFFFSPLYRSVRHRRENSKRHWQQMCFASCSTEETQEKRQLSFRFVNLNVKLKKNMQTHEAMESLKKFPV